MPDDITNGNSFPVYPYVETTAKIELLDAARRYAAHNDKPEINLPAGTLLIIDAVWEGGHLSVSSGEYYFPVSYNEVPDGLYEKLWKEFGPKTLSCPNCDGGWRYDTDERGRPLQDACYTCGNSGRITEDQYFVIRLRGAAETIGYNIVNERKKAANSNPDGEGWAFSAAENMMHEYEYTQAVTMDETEKAARILGKLIEEGNHGFVKAIVNTLAPPNEKLYEDKKPTPKKEKTSKGQGEVSADSGKVTPVIKKEDDWKPPEGNSEDEIPF